MTKKSVHWTPNGKRAGRRWCKHRARVARVPLLLGGLHHVRNVSPGGRRKTIVTQTTDIHTNEQNDVETWKTLKMEFSYSWISPISVQVHNLIGRHRYVIFRSNFIRIAFRLTAMQLFRWTWPAFSESAYMKKKHEPFDDGSLAIQTQVFVLLRLHVRFDDVQHDGKLAEQQYTVSLQRHTRHM